jgi:S-adenosylmethionine decarboxylase
MFFEGPEKKVEIGLAKGGPSLRSLGPAYWEEVVTSARAQVLSRLSNRVLDAYLLSESSLFVTDRWLTMITCGRTDLVAAVLKMVADLGLGALGYLIYERKNAHFQAYQPTNFVEDVRRLEERMPGKTSCFGDEGDHHVLVFHLDKAHRPDPGDRTLELLMHGIDPEASRIFMDGTDRTHAYVRERTEIWRVLPGFEVDDHLFQPMGYSLNAIRGPKYYTLHVTPEPIGSYVSFETNCLGPRPNRTIARVLDLFKPESCDVVFFQPSGDSRKVSCAYPVKRSIRRELSCGYQVSFTHHFRRRERAEPGFEIAP